MAVVVLWSGLALVPRAQQPTPAPEPVPTFRLRTDAVVVDVVVRGDGRPVAGLTVDDFEVREDGVVQAITSFTAKQTQAVRVVAAGEIDESTLAASTLGAC